MVTLYNRSCKKIDLQKYSKFIQSLNDDDDVQKVYTNLDNQT